MWCRATRRGPVRMRMLGGTRRVGRTRRESGCVFPLATEELNAQNLEGELTAIREIVVVAVVVEVIAMGTITTEITRTIMAAFGKGKPAQQRTTHVVEGPFGEGQQKDVLVILENNCDSKSWLLSIQRRIGNCSQVTYCSWQVMP